MSTGQSWGWEAALGLDFWAAATFFGHYGITVSTMAGLVRDGKDAPLKLYGWQRAFLRWLEPRLSNAHCERAKAADIARAQLALQLMNSPSGAESGRTSTPAA